MKKAEKIELYTKNMKVISELGDTEASHALADKFMCEILEEHGYKELVSIFKDMPKWYA